MIDNIKCYILYKWHRHIYFAHRVPALFHVLLFHYNSIYSCAAVLCHVVLPPGIYKVFINHLSTDVYLRNHGLYLCHHSHCSVTPWSDPSIDQSELKTNLPWWGNCALIGWPFCDAVDKGALIGCWPAFSLVRFSPPLYRNRSNLQYTRYGVIKIVYKLLYIEQVTVQLTYTWVLQCIAAVSVR